MAKVKKPNDLDRRRQLQRAALAQQHAEYEVAARLRPEEDRVVRDALAGHMIMTPSQLWTHVMGTSAKEFDVCALIDMLAVLRCHGYRAEQAKPDEGFTGKSQFIRVETWPEDEVVFRDPHGERLFLSLDDLPDDDD